MTNTTRARLLASSMITGVALVAASANGAFAADAAPAAAGPAATPIQELVVTWSRIPQPNLTSISPVTSVSSNTLKLQGSTRVEDLLNQLPHAHLHPQFRASAKVDLLHTLQQGILTRRPTVLAAQSAVARSDVAANAITESSRGKCNRSPGWNGDGSAIKNTDTRVGHLKRRAGKHRQRTTANART